MDDDGKPVQPPADPVAIARQMVEQQRFDDACNQIYEKGAADFTDFDQALANFRLLGGLPSTLIEAARETDAPHAVLYDLGKNPEEAARILSLPPIRMAAAVAKMAAKTVTPPAPRVSKAPEPVKPVGGPGRRTRPAVGRCPDGCLDEGARRTRGGPEGFAVIQNVYAHQMVAHVAEEMAQATYETFAKDNFWYAMNPDRAAFVKQAAPAC
jgi:hypothetical protein